jgi:hypothetical protein
MAWSILETRFGINRELINSERIVSVVYPSQHSFYYRPLPTLAYVVDLYTNIGIFNFRRGALKYIFCLILVIDQVW